MWMFVLAYPVPVHPAPVVLADKAGEPGHGVTYVIVYYYAGQNRTSAYQVGMCLFLFLCPYEVAIGLQTTRHGSVGNWIYYESSHLDGGWHVRIKCHSSWG